MGRVLLYFLGSVCALMSYRLQLDLTYEDVGNPDPNPSGIGRSFEVTLRLVENTPSRANLAAWAKVQTNVPQVVSTPSFYASHRLFGGRWSTPSNNTAIEQRKTTLLDFYIAVSRSPIFMI